ncbi:hypothetical protein SAMN06273572_102418 [Monaibacterium marinum]|uniref:Uncharacterized protein n=1 Tax=Pontivivens marinum TaxID=1690039 RepID=A0A2C9CR89_9RHOB|nr:hypothetical protein SAMN06273572_102418 [Monaibacterium marinum]
MVCSNLMGPMSAVWDKPNLRYMCINVLFGEPFNKRWLLHDENFPH